MPPIRALVPGVCIGLVFSLQVPLLAQEQEQPPQTTIEAVRAVLEDSVMYYDVDEGLSQQLAGELLGLLEPRAGELGTSAPAGEQNRILDFAVHTDGLGKYWADWSYVNAGDYNRDGAVDAWDLLPVGRCFQVARGQESWTAESELADGNGDGVVDLADVAVIADNYGHCVTTYRVVGSWVAAELPAEATKTYDGLRVLAVIPVAPVPPRQHEVLSRFRVELNMAEQPPYIWVEPLAEVRGAVSELRAPGDLMAVLNAGAWSGPVPLQVRFDIFASLGPEDAISPAWDFDGDGVFGESGAEKTISQDELWYPTVTLTEPCGRLVAVRITDADGRQDTDQAPVLAYRAVAWNQLDNQMSTNRKIGLVGGRVAIAYPVKQDAGGWQLRYLLAADEDGASWHEPRIAAALPAEPADFQLAEIAGRPALLYSLPTEDESAASYYVSAADVAGEDWNPPVLVVDGLKPEAAPPLLAEVAGSPAVVYWRPLPLTGDAGQPGCEILFQHAADAEGREWNPAMFIGEVEAHEYIERIPKIRSFGLIGGRPALFFSVEILEGSGHMLIQARDAGGSQWGEISRLSITHSATNQMRKYPVGGLVDLGGSAAMLFRDAWVKYSKSAYGLCVYGATGDRSAPLADLPLKPACPFFSGTSDEESDYSESVFIGQPADGTVVLVTQHRFGQGPVRLRAAISGDGEVWQATPEFQPGAFVDVLDCRLCRRPDAQTGEERNWLELVMSGPLDDGDGLWLTRLPLPDEFVW